MLLRSRWSLPLLLYLFVTKLFAQSATGWALDPYAGIGGALLQPAATVATPYDWDLNLVAVSVGGATNYSFIQEASALAILRDARQEAVGDEIDLPETFRAGNTVYSYGFSEGDEPIYGRLNVDVLGPSFSVRVGPNSRVGVITRLRAQGGTRDNDPQLNYFPYGTIPNGVDYQIQGNLSATAAVWGEVGLNLAHRVLVGNDGELRLGLTPKLLLPLEAIAGDNPSGVFVRQYSEDSLAITDAQATLNVSGGILNNDIGGPLAGSGLGVDLGAQYAWGITDDEQAQYTLGVSLTDVGRMTFDQNARSYRFLNPGTVTLKAEDYSFNGLDSLAFLIDNLSADINGSVNAVTTNSFAIGLPTMLGLQFAYRPIANLQLGLAYRTSLLSGSNRLSGGSSLVMAAHYSTWWFGAGLTAGLFNGDRANVGLQLRAGPLFVGTDQLIGTALRTAELSGASFYAGVRIHDFSPYRRQRRVKGRQRGRKGTQTGCYQF